MSDLCWLETFHWLSQVKGRGFFISGDRYVRTCANPPPPQRASNSLHVGVAGEPEGGVQPAVRRLLVSQLGFTSL